MVLDQPPSERQLVSVVTPTLNRCRSLRRTLDSVAAQCYAPIEHIVIDGGSSDGTIEMLRHYEMSSGLKWVSEPDAGVYSAVNKGLRLATGDILCYLNSDDAYFPYSVTTAVECLMQPEVGFVFSDLLRFDEVQERGMLLFFPPYVESYLARGNVVAQPTVFWKRAAYERCGSLDETLFLAADMDYWVRIGQRFGGMHVEEVLAFEGHHRDRLTSGPAAVEHGKAELASIRQKYTPVPKWRALQKLSDSLRSAYWYRKQAIRFLWHSRSDSGGDFQEGAWSGFRGDGSWRVDRRMLMLSMLPLVGRRFKWNVVHVSDSFTANTQG